MRFQIVDSTGLQLWEETEPLAMPTLGQDLDMLRDVTEQWHDRIARDAQRF